MEQLKPRAVEKAATWNHDEDSVCEPTEPAFRERVELVRLPCVRRPAKSWSALPVAVLSVALTSCDEGDRLEVGHLTRGLRLETPDGVVAPIPNYDVEQVRLILYGHECYSSGCLQRQPSTCRVVEQTVNSIEVEVEYRMVRTSGSFDERNAECEPECVRAEADCGLIDRPDLPTVVVTQIGQEFQIPFPVGLPWMNLPWLPRR